MLLLAIKYHIGVETPPSTCRMIKWVAPSRNLSSYNGQMWVCVYWIRHRIEAEGFAAYRTRAGWLIGEVVLLLLWCV